MMRNRRNWFVGALLMLAGGCTSTVIPPKRVTDPAAVFLTDYGRHSSLLLPDREGRLVEYAFGDWDWFATLVTQYFEKQQGMSAQAVALFRRAAGGARMIDGHTLMTQLLASGEFGAAASTYKHRVARLKADGAPIEWEPPVQPIVIRPNGVGISADTDAPASALLFADFLMTDVQKMLIGFDRTPASNAVPGGGIPSKYKVLIADLRTLNAQRQKWEDLYEQIARRSGKVIDE